MVLFLVRKYWYFSCTGSMEWHSVKISRLWYLNEKLFGKLLFLNRFYRCNRRFLSFSPPVDAIRCTANDYEW